jgi:nucleoside-diphosphate-sugar epimerase
MKILAIGGSGFLGAFAVPQLLAAGHDVAVFHRGHAAIQAGAKSIFGDRNQLQASRGDFAKFAPEVVIDFILSSGKQAAALMELFRGLAGRVVALSSGDVYRSAGIIHGTEPGLLQEVPLTEDSALRTQLHVYPPPALERLRRLYGWLDDDYDKIPIEDVVLGDRDLPGTVLRLPMIYGPGDPLHRLFPVLKRMDDGRRQIIFGEDEAQWRSPRGYVENVAAAIALAATSDRATGRVYNVAEAESVSELEWAQKVASVTGWAGKFVVMPREQVPKHLLRPENFNQQLVMSSERIRRELGYQEPVSTDEAIRRTIAWERANPQQQVDPAQFDYAAEDAALDAFKRMSQAQAS